MSLPEPYTYKGRWIHNWFSNMEPLDKPFVYKGIEYRTVEHFYQAMKCLDEGTRKHLSLMSPYEAKRYTRTIQIRPDWNEIKLSVMEFILRIKFAPGTWWCKRLLETGDQPLIEYVNWPDFYWGWNVDEKKGENRLGRLLMKIRGDLLNVPVEDTIPKRVLKTLEYSRNEGTRDGKFENLCAVCVLAQNKICASFMRKRETTCIEHFLNFQESCKGCQTLSSIPYQAIECPTFERIS